MAAHAQSNVFWLSYEPAEEECFRDVLDVVEKVFPNPGLLAGEVIRDGRRAIDAVVCTPTRVRVSGALGASKWQRKGARGRVCDAKWPAPKETVCSFLTRWADAMSAQRPREKAGSRDQLFRVMDRYHDKARKRMHARRVSGKSSPRRCRRCQRSDNVTATKADAVASPVPRMGVQVGNGISSLVWSAHSFAGLEPLPCWYSPTQSALELKTALSFNDSSQEANDFYPIGLDSAANPPLTDFSMMPELCGIPSWDQASCDLNWDWNGDWSEGMDFNMGVDLGANWDWNTVMPVYECDV
ncbi:hypothetical protein HIM_10572 [Hirsutella minnesotensis 3608]|uniref:Uncharacterized protein n=1 Tax=Hirsutella minnesotensis 3608 TaxID=1043627 RepID=A0A0F8A252_9HYPO|nr:hypothetical protein HIM_10572 [Hirsutella minnesotensis 3608]